MVSKIYVWINILQSAEPCLSFLNELKGQSQEIVKDPIGLRGQSEDILQYKEPNIVGWDSVRILDKDLIGFVAHIRMFLIFYEATPNIQSKNIQSKNIQQKIFSKKYLVKKNLAKSILYVERAQYFQCFSLCIVHNFQLENTTVQFYEFGTCCEL